MGRLEGQGRPPSEMGRCCPSHWGAPGSALTERVPGERDSPPLREIKGLFILWLNGHLAQRFAMCFQKTDSQRLLPHTSLHC